MGSKAEWRKKTAWGLIIQCEGHEAVPIPPMHDHNMSGRQT